MRLVLLSLASYVLLMAMYSVAFDQPRQREQRSKEKRLTSLHADLHILEVTAGKLSVFQREVQLREAKLFTLGRIVPRDPEMDALFDRIREQGRAAGVTVLTCRAGPPVGRGFYEELPAEVAVSGSFRAIVAFVTRLGWLPRLIRVGRIEMAADVGGCRATLSLVAFRCPERTSRGGGEGP